LSSATRHPILMSYEPLHHKYRPQTFEDLVGQEAIATTLTHAIQQERIAPAYLFTGPRGTGKTSSARIFAKSLNCLNSPRPTEKPCGSCTVCRGIETANGSALDVIEIDAASNTGVDNIRELIEKAQFAPALCRYKVYLIDEVHMLSQAAFNCLLKTLEEPPKHVVFILATTDPQRVLPTIISRCQRFDFRRIPLESMVNHLQKIAVKEEINITKDAINLVAQIAQGGLRDAESLLDQLSLLSDGVTLEKVWDLVGAVPEKDLMALLRAIAANQTTLVLEIARRLMDRGREPLIVLQNLAGFYRDLLIAHTAPKRADLVACTEQTWIELCQESQNWQPSEILAGQKHLKDSEIQLKNSTQPRLWLEVTLLGLLPDAKNKIEISASSKTLAIAPSQTKSIPQQSPAPTIDNQPIENNLEPSPIPRQETESPINQSQTPPKDRLDTVTSDRANNTDVTSNELLKTQTEQNLQPIAEISPSQPENTENSPDLEKIWQQVISHLQPISTKSLAQQHCSLLKLDEAIALVQITSQPLMDMLYPHRIPNLEAAFLNAIHRQVQVKLTLPRSPSSGKILNREMRSPSSFAAKSRSISPIEFHSVPATSTPASNSLEHSPAPYIPAVENRAIAQEPPTNLAVQAIETPPISMVSLAILDTDIQPHPAKLLEEVTPETTETPEDGVAIASQCIVNFFQNKVIPLTDNFELNEESLPKNIPPKGNFKLDVKPTMEDVLPDDEEF
jgi:DNA polymerase III subunit gamma/tau